MKGAGDGRSVFISYTAPNSNTGFPFPWENTTVLATITLNNTQYTTVSNVNLNYNTCFAPGNCYYP